MVKKILITILLTHKTITQDKKKKKKEGGEPNQNKSPSAVHLLCYKIEFAIFDLAFSSTSHVDMFVLNFTRTYLVMSHETNASSMSVLSAFWQFHVCALCFQAVVWVASHADFWQCLQHKHRTNVAFM